MTGDFLTRHQAHPHPLAFPALLLGNVALAFGPWMVRLADVGPVAAGIWRLALALPLLWLVAKTAGQEPHLPRRSLVPIIVGYIIAHYLTYLVEYGQTTIVQLSDPFSRGDDYLGTADLEVNYWLSFHPDFLARLKVGAVIVGHVLGVIAAHDRAVRILPRRHQLTGQLSLLVAMVFFTVGGLYLLFAA